MLGVTNMTVREVMKRDRRFAEDVEQILAERNDDVEEALLKTALSGKRRGPEVLVDEPRRDDMGEPFRVEHTGRHGARSRSLRRRRSRCGTPSSTSRREVWRSTTWTPNSSSNRSVNLGPVAMVDGVEEDPGGLPGDGGALAEDSQPSERGDHGVGGKWLPPGI